MLGRAKEVGMEGVGEGRQKECNGARNFPRQAWASAGMNGTDYFRMAVGVGYLLPQVLLAGPDVRQKCSPHLLVPLSLTGHKIKYPQLSEARRT